MPLEVVRTSSAKRLDPREDSPMWQDADQGHDSVEKGSLTNGLSGSRNKTLPVGFTAVNGDHHRVTSFRPDDSAKPSLTVRESGQSNAAEQPQDRRSSQDQPIEIKDDAEQEDERHQHDKKKRKRNDSAASETENGSQRDGVSASQTASPTHRATKLSSVISTASPDPTEYSRSAKQERRESELIPFPVRARTRSPDSTKWSEGEPLPPPRPETEAGIAESLRRELQGTGQDSNTNQDDDDSLDDSRSQNKDQTPKTEDNQQENGTERKKRKRNFSNRTKTGCHTCRARKKKCDEGKPTCGNCLRGQFSCGGYGPKPSSLTGSSLYGRTATPLLSKQHFESPHGPVSYYQPHPEGPGPSSYHAWNRMPPGGSYDPHSQQGRYVDQAWGDPRRPGSHDSWGPRPSWAQAEAPPPYMADRMPPSDYSQIPPMSAYGHDQRQQPPDPWGNPAPMPSHRARNGVGSLMNSGSSIWGHGSKLPLNYGPNGELTERSKMITGQPYRHFVDEQLMRDRQSCLRAVEAYNDAAKGSSTVSYVERERLFHVTINPAARSYPESARDWRGPTGTCGSHTIVESPFNCEFGYNLHLGDNVMIAPNCSMQDACDIYIGHRTVIGPNVRFYCVTSSVDYKSRKGSHGTFVAGAIVVEEDCFIGADVIILPFRTIGKGSVIGAGSVVTKDVKPYTVVSGNPAKVIRRIESGPKVDQHQNPDIQEQNDRMLEKMQSGLSQGYRNRTIR